MVGSREGSVSVDHLKVAFLDEAVDPPVASPPRCGRPQHAPGDGPAPHRLSVMPPMHRCRKPSNELAFPHPERSRAGRLLRSPIRLQV